MTTEIDYQVLRDVSERAITAMTHLSILPGDDDLLSEKKLKELGIDIDAIHAFKIMAGPETVLSLLDERDALNERMAELEANLAELAEDQQKAIESIKQADSAVKLAHEKFSALAAENARLKAAHPQPFGHEMMKALDAYEKHQDEVPETGMLNAFFILRDSIRVETPATDSFLSEVRAQAFNDLCSVFVKDATVVGLDDGDIVTVKEAKDALLHCAEQLRKGGNQ
ncbi:ead/Ea22-like family protein [Escherichia coli]|uniref:ead/Ea22-like family protein n=1 Tax=Escherichia coli TaxID=562 RepID=UPI001CD94C7D|nr:ead/Ea22-like family protein [Escherichia coli]EKE6832127.1 ead/Ea22-like family protein [Escherichia coli]MCA2070677.1 ead/Ea22-like family protein [Escherichia coli]MCA2103342.1 ead/Ea22-like family protein [Escherichia coli]